MFYTILLLSYTIILLSYTYLLLSYTVLYYLTTVFYYHTTVLYLPATVLYYLTTVSYNTTIILYYSLSWILGTAQLTYLSLHQACHSDFITGTSTTKAIPVAGFSSTSATALLVDIDLAATCSYSSLTASSRL